MSNDKQEARDFILQMFPKKASPSMSIFAAKVSYYNGADCSIIDGSGGEMTDCRWLIDAYTPVVGDIVLVMRNGTDKFILGRTTDVR